jgi:hypothetical protein
MLLIPYNNLFYMKNTWLTAGLIAGTLDITAAFLHFMLKGGKNPVVILQYIASGLFGRELANSQRIMPLLGLLLHYFIALTFALFYFFVAHKILGRLAWPLAGTLYGLGVWVVMNKIIVPLSLIPPRPSTLSNDLTQLGILILCIGLPIAYFSHQMR